MSPSLRRHRLFKLALAVWLVLSITGAITLTSLWQRGILKRWAQAKIVEYFLQKVQPHLPFQIEELEVDGTWRELLSGHISRVSTVLHWATWRLRLSGPIEITRPGKQIDFYSLKFLPLTTIESDQSPDLAARSSAVELDLYARANQGLKTLIELKASADTKSFEWKHFGIQIHTPHLAASWENDQARALFSLQSLNWKPSLNHIVNMGELQISGHAALQLKPVQVGPEIEFQWQGKDIETLWDKLYLDVPLARLPGTGRITLGPEPRLSLQVGQPLQGHAPLQIEATPHQVHWKSEALSIPLLISNAMDATGSGSGPFTFLAALRDLDFRNGTITSEGRVKLPLGKHPSADGTVHIRDGALQIHKAAFAARGVRIDLPFSTQHGAQGIVSAEDVYFRRLHGKLAPTDLSVEAAGPNIYAPEGVRFRFGAPPGRGSTTIPLTIDGIPLEINTVTGQTPYGEESFLFESALRLPETNIENILHPLCVPHRREIPAKVSFNLNHVGYTPNDVDPDGELDFQLFEGMIRIKEMGFFDFRSAVPEIDFDAAFDGIRLDQLGDWSGFGDMTGTLQGFAHDVTFQRFLPTHFDFSIDAIPSSSHAVEFSPEAMKNLVALFAGDAMDHVPGFAKDTFFGTISRRLGGFDVAYAGLSLFADGGTILLETHDLPDIYYIMKKHYIFWGHRFKMPLKTDQYPVVMNETGLTRVINVMGQEIQTLADQKAAKEAKEHPERVHKETENEADSQCLPPVF